MRLVRPTRSVAKVLVLQMRFLLLCRVSAPALDTRAQGKVYTDKEASGADSISRRLAGDTIE
jgi:hypothetical protein